MKAFIEGMPKAELHVHLEGTLEPEHITISINYRPTQTHNQLLELT
jgi:adenosine deaminase